MNSLFLYGTLCVPEVFELVTDLKISDHHVQRARAESFVAYYVSNQQYPGVKKGDRGQYLKGLYIEVGNEALSKLWIYEGEDDYSLQDISVKNDRGESLSASLFFPKKSSH